MLRQQCLALLLELAVAADYLLMPRMEFGEFNGLHRIEVDEPSSFCSGALQPTLQALELCLQHLIIRPLRAGAKSRLTVHQNLRA